MTKHPLQRLIALEGDYDVVAREAVSWMQEQVKSHGRPDGHAMGIVLLRANLEHVLKSYLEGALSGEQLRAWADLMECNDFLDYEAGREGDVADVLFVLATPELNRPMSKQLARDLLDSVRRS